MGDISHALHEGQHGFQMAAGAVKSTGKALGAVGRGFGKIAGTSFTLGSIMTGAYDSTKDSLRKTANDNAGNQLDDGQKVIDRGINSAARRAGAQAGLAYIGQSIGDAAKKAVFGKAPSRIDNEGKTRGFVSLGQEFVDSNQQRRIATLADVRNSAKDTMHGGLPEKDERNPDYQQKYDDGLLHSGQNKSMFDRVKDDIEEQAKKRASPFTPSAYHNSSAGQSSDPTDRNNPNANA